MTDYGAKMEARPPSAWAFGGIAFAGILMIMLGTFQVLQGLAAVIDDEFFVVADEYAFSFDVTTWGWIHLVVGVIVAASGMALLGGSAWGAAMALVLAVVAAVSNFFFIPYYPVWSLLMIAIALWVIWSLTRPGALEQREGRRSG